MAAAALIKFTQGALVGDGLALLGVLTTSVTVNNSVNTGVLSWQVDVLDVPGGSAVATGVLASNNNSSTPSGSFTPDVRGSYRIRLQVWDAINRVGTATDLDIRVFAVTEVNGLIAPPAQIWPRPLPPVASGELGNKADELNFLGQTRGFAGTGADGLLEALITLVDKINATSKAGQFFGGASKVFDYAKGVRGLRIGDHSYSDIQQGGSNPAIATSDYTWYAILAGMLGLPRERTFNHASAGTQLTQANAGYGWVTMLQGILSTKSQTQAFPAVSYGELLVLGYGINDQSQNTAANQAKIIADVIRCKESIARAHRAAVWYPCQGSAQWNTTGVNWSNSTNIDATIATARQASVVDSSGSSTATLTLPSGYRGETITFLMNALSGGSLIVTWGGTVSGTTSIVGRTDTLSNLTVQAQCSYPVVFDAATNGLSAANAGQTITVRITTVSASTFTLEGAMLEAKEPAPIVLMNQPRLPEKNITWEFGDGAITSGLPGISSPTAGQFVSANDAGGALTVTDGGGGVPGGTTMLSVTNTTTGVMSANATATRTGVKFSLVRHVKGYSGIGGAANTNFSGATVASHAAADTNITDMNAALVVLKNRLGAKAVIADLDAEIGGDLTPPSGQYTYYESGGLHLNELGQRAQARIVYNAIGTLAQESALDDGALVAGGGASRIFGTLHWPTRANNVLTTAYAAYGATYTCVVGDVFAQWIYISDPATEFVNVGVEQTNAPVTSGSTIRMATFSDVNAFGYPNGVINDLGTLALGTTAGMKTIANTHVLRPGWYWVAFRVESLGTTASQLRTAIGPQQFGPYGSWIAAGGTAPVAPMGYKLTGQATGSAFPDRFYLTGASVVATVPLISATVTTRV